MWWQSCIFSIITPGFSVTWSFRNHSNMPIWCSINIYYYHQCLKHLCCLIFVQFFSEIYFKIIKEQHLFETEIVCSHFWSIWCIISKQKYWFLSKPCTLLTQSFEWRCIPNKHLSVLFFITHWTLSWGLGLRFPLVMDDGSSSVCSHIALAPLLYNVWTICEWERNWGHTSQDKNALWQHVPWKCFESHSLLEGPPVRSHTNKPFSYKHSKDCIDGLKTQICK